MIIIKHQKVLHLLINLLNILIIKYQVQIILLKINGIFLTSMIINLIEFNIVTVSTINQVNTNKISHRKNHHYPHNKINKDL
jgi:hypothetical protein